MLKMPTENQVFTAAVKSDRAALEVSIKKYNYLRNLTNTTVNLGPCALCWRHSAKGDCPLKNNCINLWCISDFDLMIDMGEQGNLVGFKKYANRIYKKLVKALAKLEKKEGKK